MRGRPAPLCALRSFTMAPRATAISALLQWSAIVARSELFVSSKSIQHLIRPDSEPAYHTTRRSRHIKLRSEIRSRRHCPTFNARFGCRNRSLEAEQAGGITMGGIDGKNMAGRSGNDKRRFCQGRMHCQYRSASNLVLFCAFTC